MYAEIERIGEAFGVLSKDIPAFITRIESDVVRPLIAETLCQLEISVVLPLTVRISDLESRPVVD